MDMIWYVLRIFYVLGLVPVAPLFLIMATHARQDFEVSVPVLIGCGIYFVFGYLLFKTIPTWLENRVLARVAHHKAKGFTPQWEVVSMIYNRYMGFDPRTQKVLYINVDDGTETLVDFNNINAWELEVDGNEPPLLKLLTRIPTLPVIKLCIDRHKLDEWKANLGMIFG